VRGREVEEDRLVRVVGALNDEVRRLVDEEEKVVLVENVYSFR
jgi:hypothetical protein